MWFRKQKKNPKRKQPFSLLPPVMPFCNHWTVLNLSTEMKRRIFFAMSHFLLQKQEGKVKLSSV